MVLKYSSPRGSTTCLFGADYLRFDGRPLLFAEGEFDTMVIWQELNDLVDTVSFGGAAKAFNGLTGKWLIYLLRYLQILVAYDNDDAGRKGAERLAAQSKRMGIITVPHGKDINEFYLAGGDLRSWLTFYLQWSGDAKEDKYPVEDPIQQLPLLEDNLTGRPEPVKNMLLEPEQDSTKGITISLEELPLFLQENGLRSIGFDWPNGGKATLIVEKLRS